MKHFKLFSAESAVFRMASAKHIDWKSPGKEKKENRKKNKKKTTTLPIKHMKFMLH